MKNKIFKTFNLLVCMALIGMSSSCSREETPEASMTSLITASSWKARSLVISNGMGTKEDIFDFLPKCSTDNLWTFAADQVFTMSEGPTKCHPDDDDDWTGTWEFDASESTLTIDGDVFNLESLTSSELILSMEPYDDGTTWTYNLSHL